VKPSTVGVYQLEVKAEDKAGNLSAATIQITIADTVAPVISVLTSMVELNTNTNEYKNLTEKSLYALAGLSATDDCDGTQLAATETLLSKIHFTSDYNKSDYTPSKTGSIYDVHITVEDSSGNTSSYILKVKVTDNTPPTLIVSSGRYQAPNSLTEAAFKYDAVQALFDDYSANSSITLTTDFAAEADPAVVGTYYVTFTATDECGNQSQETVPLVIEDTVPPILSGAASLSLNTSSDAFKNLTASSLYGQLSLTGSSMGRRQRIAPRLRSPLTLIRRTMTQVRRVRAITSMSLQRIPMVMSLLNLPLP
jgi:hypothetical protein